MSLDEGHMGHPGHGVPEFVNEDVARIRNRAIGWSRDVVLVKARPEIKKLQTPGWVEGAFCI